MKTIEYRTVMRSKDVYCLQYKRGFGWRFKSIQVGMDGATVWDSFKSEEEVDKYVRISTKCNPKKYLFIKHPMLYMFTA